MRGKYMYCEYISNVDDTLRLLSITYSRGGGGGNSYSYVVNGLGGGGQSFGGGGRSGQLGGDGVLIISHSTSLPYDIVVTPPANVSLVDGHRILTVTEPTSTIGVGCKASSGSAYNSTSGLCESCPPGTYSNYGLNCAPCAAGFFSNSTGR